MKTYNEIVRSVYGGPRNSFWSGFASVLSLAGTRKTATNRRPGRRLRSEAEALSQDWSNVSRDLQHAFQRAGGR